MAQKVCDVCAAMERWAPAGLAYEWDRVGLSVGEPGASVSTVLVCLTVTEAALAAAKRAGARMIVSHHPLIWEPLKALCTEDPKVRLALDCVRAGIACFAAHTNLDVAPEGVSHLLAKKIGLSQCEPLLSVSQAGQVKLATFVPNAYLDAVRNAVSEAGAGVIGNYSHCSFSTVGIGTFRPNAGTAPFSGTKNAVNEEPEHRFETLVTKARLPKVLEALMAAHPYEEVAYDIVCLENRDAAIGLGVRGVLEGPQSLGDFAAAVCRRLGLRDVRMVGPARKRVQSVAVLGGSGGGEAAAIPKGVDVYVTGDVRYHDAQAAEQCGLALIDAGHAGTEKVFVPAVARYLRKHLPGLKVVTYAEPELFRTIPR